MLVTKTDEAKASVDTQGAYKLPVSHPAKSRVTCNDLAAET